MESLTPILLQDFERQKCEIWTRVMGYHRPVSQWNQGKQGEYAERIFFKLNLNKHSFLIDGKNAEEHSREQRHIEPIRGGRDLPCEASGHSCGDPQGQLEGCEGEQPLADYACLAG